MRNKNLNNLTLTVTEPVNFVHIEDIVIPDDFKRTHCGHNKIRWAKEYYQRNGFMDKPISVISETNERGKPNKLILIDEYSRYKAAIELGLTDVEVKYIDIDEYDTY
jgi:hypothetical protein